MCYCKSVNRSSHFSQCAYEYVSVRNVRDRPRIVIKERRNHIGHFISLLERRPIGSVNQNSHAPVPVSVPAIATATALRRFHELI